jgi:hypothetical protein
MTDTYNFGKTGVTLQEKLLANFGRPISASFSICIWKQPGSNSPKKSSAQGFNLS